MLLIELLELTTYPDMVNRLRSIYTLIQKGATAGERSGAEAAYKRIMDAIKRDYGAAQAKKAEAKVKGGASSTKTRSSTRGSSTRQKTKAKPSGSRQNYGSQRSSGTVNNKYRDPKTGWIFVILRFTDSSAGKRGSDKVWGYAENGDYVMSFWGAYGKNIRTKPLASIYEADALYQSKLKKGYQKVEVANNPGAYSFIFNQFD